MIKNLLLVAFLVFGLTNCKSSKEATEQTVQTTTEATVQTVKTPELAFLLALQGKYPYESELFETEPMKSRLEKVLGEKYFSFLDRIEVQVPIEVIGNEVFIEGIKAHSGGFDDAAILIDVEKNLIWVMIYENGEKLSVFKDDRDVKMPKRFFDKVSQYK